MRQSVRRPAFTLLAITLAITTVGGQRTTRAALRPEDIDAIATLLMLEDARKYDAAELRRILSSTHPEVRRRAIQSAGRIADKTGASLIDLARTDKDVEVAATAVWAAGQLRDPAAIPWLAATLSDLKTPAAAAREAAIALGKIQSPEARAALASYLSTAPPTAAAATVGDALLSIGRFPAGGDLSRAETVFDAEIDKVIQSGVTSAELERARNQALASFWRGLTTIDGKAQALGTYAVLQGGHERLFTAPKAYESVSIEDIKQVASQLLRPTNRTVGVLSAASATSGEEG